jgi:ornithine cyclodeaminase/alanine dehydrogenase-like protein (mu-crystallin family)
MAKTRRSPALPRHLRLGKEPCRYYAEAEVHAALTADPAGYYRFVKQNLVAIAEGRAEVSAPPKQVFADPATGGDFRVMPCELRAGSRAVKTVKVIGTNTVQRKVRDQITVGKLLVLDPKENFVSAVMEACLLSSARTGVCAALAIDVLARARARLVVVGSGRVGHYAALYAVASGGVREVTFCDSVRGRARDLAKWFGSVFSGVTSNACPVGAVADADVVILATTSAVPVARPPCWGANLVVSLGADTDTQSELDPAWARHADIYCDFLDSLRFGDLRAWLDAGQIDATAVTPIMEALRNPPRGGDRPRVFVSTGSALFDNLTAYYLLERARTKSA